MLRKKIIKYFVIFIVVIILSPVFSYAAADEYPAYSIKSYLKKNGDLFVNEEFIFDFGENKKHGVFRNIPLIIKEGSSWYSIQSVSVKDKNDEPYLFETTDSGNIAQIKIGNPNLVLTGSHYYNLSYTLTNVGGTDSIEWKAFNPMRESISKYQSYIYLPVPIDSNLLKAECSFVPERINAKCELVPLSKDGLTVGFKLDADNILKEEILIKVNYPKGIIFPPDNTKEIKSTIYIKSIILAFALISLAAIIARYRNKILNLFKNLHKPIMNADSFSYLARAVAFRNEITEDDVIATIVDLSLRGYISLTQFATPVGINESIDYSIEIASDDVPIGAEADLINSFKEGIPSLAIWISENFNNIKFNLEEKSRKEISGIILSKDENPLPHLIGFKLK